MSTNGSDVIKNIDDKRLCIAIVGAGLVGSLEALFMAKRGHDVHLFEFREDLRKTPHVRGRSINLAMSIRARLALKHVGLEEQMVRYHGIPMRARMIHTIDGNMKQIPYDPNNNQAIYSVGRRYLNELLLKESEKFPNVTRHFNHKLVEANLGKAALTFLRTDDQKIVNFSADLVIGADGAFSAVRKSMIKQPLFDYSQKYIEHGYVELCIPPTKDNNFAMAPNFLHIWPRGTFMMIALPNQDKSWTVTLFMPFQKFKELGTEEDLLFFFGKYFPDSLQLIGKRKLIKDFFSTSPSSLVAVKCRPYHTDDKALIIGDAAHAIVPFYGQGMNAGFEDCCLLDSLLMKYGTANMNLVLEEFSEIRWNDAYAICDLAMYNYVEMRDLVNKKSYLLRKKMDDILYWAFPKIWVPLYNSVTFTNMRYSDCIANREWQNKVFERIIFFLGFCSLTFVVYILYANKGLIF